MNAMRQLALPFRHAPHFAAEDMLRGPSNREALAWLGRTATWPFGRLALWGGAGRGKSHLLHLWAGHVGAEVRGGPLLGDRVELHAVAVMFSLFAGGAAFGFLGVLMAVPVAATLGVLARFWLRRYLQSPLYLDPPPP